VFWEGKNCILSNENKTNKIPQTPQLGRGKEEEIMLIIISLQNVDNG